MAPTLSKMTLALLLCVAAGLLVSLRPAAAAAPTWRAPDLETALQEIALDGETLTLHQVSTPTGSNIPAQGNALGTGYRRP